MKCKNTLSRIFVQDFTRAIIGKFLRSEGLISNNTFLGIAIAVMSLIGLSTSQAIGQPMVDGQDDWEANEILTIGETINGYTPVGILDGIGAYKLNHDTVRVLVNHEIPQDQGYAYDVNNGLGGTFQMTGARVSFFDIDKDTMEIVDGGLAYDTIYDANGNIASNTSFLSNNFKGFTRFCSSRLSEREQFGRGQGLKNRIYFTGEEDGGTFNPVGGAEWALDPEDSSIWHVPAMGRGAWENNAEICTGSKNTVAFILADDTSPFDADGDSVKEAAPLYLYIGEKDPQGDFLGQNGLRNGKLYVWVPKNPNIKDPSDFNTSGTQLGEWVEIDNSPTGSPSEDGSTGYDEYGYPTQRTLWTRAEDAGAFQFSRPEDMSINPKRCNEVIQNSTGRSSDFGGADRVGTVYTINTNFKNLKATLTIIYDGDADPTQALRSPDNVDWAHDGFAYIQEDRAVDDLFGAGAVNPNEAGIVKLNPKNGKVKRIANIDRSVVLDASIVPPTNADDLDAGVVGAWETSGILDVSRLFDINDDGIFLIFDVQAHGIRDQLAGSRINDSDLVEGGQLLFLKLHNKDDHHDGHDGHKDGK